MGFSFDEIWKQYKAVHKSVHSEMSNKLRYTEPKIFHGGKEYDLKKPWYIYYYIENPNKPLTDGGFEMKQFRHKFKVKQIFKTRKERMEYLRFCKGVMSKMLKDGFNPFHQEVKENIVKSARYNLKYALKVKSKEVKPTTLKDYTSRLNQFIDYLDKLLLADADINKVRKKHVSQFLNQFNPNNSNKMKAMLSALYAILASEDIVPVNFIKEIRNRKVLKTNTKKLFTKDEMFPILEMLKEQDSLLFHFIEMVGFMFWRPIEVVRIKVSDVDFKTKTIRGVETKTKASKIKFIPDIIVDSLKELTKKNNEFLLTPDSAPDWETTEPSNKRDFFTKRFQKFREKNKLDKDLTPYSFRYFFITTAYLNLRKENDIKSSIETLSRITGHTSKAIHNYILVNDIELPDDYSELLK